MRRNRSRAYHPSIFARWSRKRKIVVGACTAVAIVLLPTIVVLLLSWPYKVLAADFPNQLKLAKAEGVPLSSKALEPHIKPEDNAWPLYERAGEAPPLGGRHYYSKRYTAAEIAEQLDFARSLQTEYAKALVRIRQATEKRSCFIPVSQHYYPQEFMRLSGWIAALVEFAYASVHDGKDASAGAYLRLARKIQCHLYAQLDQQWWIGGSSEPSLSTVVNEVLQRVHHPKDFLQNLGDWPLVERPSLREVAAYYIASGYEEIQKDEEGAEERLGSLQGSWDAFTSGPYPIYLSANVAFNAARAELLKASRTVWAIVSQVPPQPDSGERVSNFVGSLHERCTYAGDPATLHRMENFNRLEQADLEDRLFAEGLRVLRDFLVSGHLPSRYKPHDPRIGELMASGRVFLHLIPSGFALYTGGPNGRDDGGPKPSSDDEGFLYTRPVPGVLAPLGDTRF